MHSRLSLENIYRALITFLLRFSRLVKMAFMILIFFFSIHESKEHLMMVVLFYR